MGCANWSHLRTLKAHTNETTNLFYFKGNSMKINSMFQTLVFFVTLMTFSMSFPTFAQRTDVQVQAIQDAERDAKASVTASVWFLTGCIGGFFGYITAYTYHHPVPTVPLLGKSPEYVASYTDTYRAKTHELQSRYALNGCVIGAAVPLCLTALVSTGELPTPAILR